MEGRGPGRVKDGPAARPSPLASCHMRPAAHRQLRTGCAWCKATKVQATGQGAYSIVYSLLLMVAAGSAACAWVAGA